MVKTKKFVIIEAVKSFFKSLAVLAIIGYVFYTVGFSIYRNYQVNREIESLRADIDKLKSEIAQLNNLIVYYRSDGFKEIEARKRLGLKSSGEQVIILPKQEERQSSDDFLSSNDGSLSRQETQISNPIKWFNYIFR